MQANCNKKQILPMKYQVWTSAFLQNFRIFWCFFVVKIILDGGYLQDPLFAEQVYDTVNGLFRTGGIMSRNPFTLLEMTRLENGRDPGR